MLKKVNVGIIGHTGRLGRPLVEILGRHPFTEVVYKVSSGWSEGGLDKIDVVFLALPHGISGKYVERFGKKKIIDLSLDHRCNSRWVYGLPEIFGGEIRNAEKIANPGCYATSIILGLFPLKGKILQASISSTSGISGAGMRPATFSLAGMSVMKIEDDNFLVYKEGRKHPQIREIAQVLGTRKILFVPQRIDTADRGIVSTIFVRLCQDVEDAQEFFDTAYGKCPFVRILESGTSIETRRVAVTNFCDIKILQFGKDVVIISALDNLIKGGAGQAVQNFNLMCGFPETTGLV